ncbi:GNAT family N-acetyltransferase [Alkalicoccus urumqiensis]|uniref:GNAT family N-acetyltransferase n=2 Tax=Alkalicoccus urumqiensis TaxID=1548213 RepID=A0A2P6MG63_ALKUR|nr:GNAT family N-acetyltransferase [Alkalicoccus urumqiensis]
MDITMKDLQSEEEIREVYPLMNQLRPHLDEEEYVSLVLEAQAKEGYRLRGLFEEGRLCALIGFQPMITLYYGRFVWVSDLVTDVSRRSEGFGAYLLRDVETWAHDHAFTSVALSSGLEKTEAHRFYEEKAGYSRASFVFRKTDLKEE